jgi:hypothetical protein
MSGIDIAGEIVDYVVHGAREKSVIYPVEIGVPKAQKLTHLGHGYVRALVVHIPINEFVSAAA